MKPTVLQFHTYRRDLRGDDNNEMSASFLFSMLPEASFQAGETPTHNDCFWTEVHLARAVAEQPGWKQLSKAEKIKYMFQHAVEQIVAVRRKLRQAPLIWTTSAKYLSGPPWDPRSIDFPKAKPVTFDAEEREDAYRFLARKGAGLAK